MKPQEHTSPISATMLAALHQEVNSLGSVILSNPLSPILQNFLLKVEKDKIVIAASDEQTSIISSLPLEGQDVAEPFQIAVPARMLKDTLKSLPQQPVNLAIDKARYNISLETSNGRFKIACESAEDFPNVFTFPQGKADVVLPAEVLQQAIKQTLFAVSKDELRPELSGVLLNLSSDGLTFVSTDGHRLVCYKRKNITSDKQIKCIVPAKALQLLSQLLASHPTQEVKLHLEEKKLFISWEHLQLIISLINESYPDYENVIPRHNPHKLTLNTNCLAALRRIAIYANKATQELRFHVEKDKIKIVAEDLDFSNKAHETVPCQYQGPEMEIGFNARLLIEMLRVLPSQEDIQLALDMPNKAVLVHPQAQAEDEDLSMLIMPILLDA